MNITSSSKLDSNDDVTQHVLRDRFIAARPRTSRRGFTLVEMAAALMMMMILSGTIVTLVSQHTFLMQILNNSSFLSEEAPRINALMSSIVNQADSYFIFENLADAQAPLGAANPSNDGGAVRLTFRNPSGATDESIISYDPGESKLNYYYKDPVAGWSAVPNWTITSRPTAVWFQNGTGILEVVCIGPDGEGIIFSGASE